MRARKRALADSGDVVTVSVDETKLIWARHSREGFRVAAIDHGVVAVTKRATLECRRGSVSRWTYPDGSRFS